MSSALAHGAISAEARRLFGYNVVTAVACSFAGLAAFVLLYATVQIVRRFVDADIRRPKSLKQPDKTPAALREQFVQQASLLHISERVAGETYKALSACLPDDACFSPNDDLRSQVGIAEDQIVSILYSLPQVCCRLPYAFDVAAIVSVYDLLAHLEAAPPLRSAKSLQRVACAAAAPPHASASPLAGLQNASPRDSRFRTRPHFSGVKRRATDYSGPHRRATDRPADAAYEGPRRRASDPSATGRPVAEIPPALPEQRSLGKQHEAQHYQERRQQERRQSADNSASQLSTIPNSSVAAGSRRGSDRQLPPPDPQNQPSAVSAPAHGDVAASSGRIPSVLIPDRLPDPQTLSPGTQLHAL